jgi:hypothetical protein
MKHTKVWMLAILLPLSWYCLGQTYDKVPSLPSDTANTTEQHCDEKHVTDEEILARQYAQGTSNKNPVRHESQFFDRIVIGVLTIGVLALYIARRRQRSWGRTAKGRSSVLLNGVRYES